MENIPMFTNEYGVASLILESVPYRKEAYIRIQSTLEPEKLLEECVKFCTLCGAQRIYATGHEFLEQYPFHTAILQLKGNRESLEESDASLFPVTEKTAEKWRNIYNERMKLVDNAAWISFTGMKKMLKEGDAYFVHRNGELLGIGKAKGDRMDAVASVQPGAGADVVHALSHTLSSETVTIEVASTNERALRLYERLGFLQVAELSRWYEIPQNNL